MGKNVVDIDGKLISAQWIVKNVQELFLFEKKYDFL